MIKCKNIISLFDGMSCGQIALKKLGVQYENYFASEIDKFAIAVTNQNFPDTVQLGDITKITEKTLNQLPPIDLLMGGSPCQGFSFAGKQLNFEDPRSKLFFEYVRILKILKKRNPNIIFLLENVKMKKQYQDGISEALGVQPIEINSALVSAQNRKRLYWTNIPNIQQPKDKFILLNDILEDEVDEKYYLSENAVKRLLNGSNFSSKIVSRNGKSSTVMPSITKLARGMDLIESCNPKFGRTEKAKKIRKANLANGVDYSPFAEKEMTACDSQKMGTLTQNPTRHTRVMIGNIYQSNSAAGRVYTTDDKATTLKAVGGGGGGGKTGLYAIKQKSRGKNKGGLHTEKSPTLTKNSWEQNHHLVDGYSIRRLTPLECERLQTVPEGYTAFVSDSQRYKMLGNGWTIDVITHIFKQIK